MQLTQIELEMEVYIKGILGTKVKIKFSFC